MTQDAMTDDEKAIRALVAEWMERTRAGEGDAVLPLMTEDAVFMVPGREPFGREAFKQASTAQARMRIEGTSEIVELKVLGGWAFARTRIDITVTPEGAQPVRRAGYTLTLFHKEADSRWRLARDANLLTAVPTDSA